MGWREWFKRLFGGRGPAPTMVRFRDPAANGRIVQIPASQLQPGMIQVQFPGSEGPVWVWANQLEPSSQVRHSPFDEEVRAYIREIQETFAEHRPLSFEEWEDGFRSDANAEEEIAIWSCAADVYRAFAGNEPSPERRKDIYRVIVTCLTSSPETIWHVLELGVLSRLEAEQIVKRVYGKHAL